MSDNQKFITGINYWPVNKAMYWWRDFDVREAKDIDREEFYHNPRNNISKLYQNYKEWLKEL